MKICGVYLIISPSGRRYIGSSIDIKRRWARYNRVACPQQSALYNSLKKYGPDKHKFKILYECPTEDRLFWERIFGDLYRSLTDFGGLNHCLPKTDEKVISYSLEHRKKIGEWSRRYQCNPQARINQSNVIKEILARPEIKQAHKKRMKDFFSNPENRKAQSDRVKEYMNRPEVKKRNSDAGKKRFSTLESRQIAAIKTKMVYQNNPQLGKDHSIKMREYYKSNKSPLCKRVINVDTGEIYDSAKKAAEAANMNYDNFKNRLNGGVKIKINFKYIE